MDWSANGILPWAAYRAFMSGRLIVLDKYPGVRPVGVGETWQHLFAKIVFKVTGTEATMACQDDQLCARLKAGIDGAIHKVRALWDEKSSTKEWGFLLVDAKNTFNKINQVGMLLTVRHLRPSGYRFVFDCYCYWSLLVLRNSNETAGFLHIGESVLKGEHVKMIAYGIIILPLFKNTKQYIPDVTQPWYADDAGALGTFARLKKYFDSLTRQGLGRGYHPIPSKRVLIVRPENLQAGKLFRSRHGFKECTGARYLEGYIRDDKTKHNWLRERKLT